MKCLFVVSFIKRIVTHAGSLKWASRWLLHRRWSSSGIWGHLGSVSCYGWDTPSSSLAGRCWQLAFLFQVHVQVPEHKHQDHVHCPIQWEEREAGGPRIPGEACAGPHLAPDHQHSRHHGPPHQSPSLPHGNHQVQQLMWWVGVTIGSGCGGVPAEPSMTTSQFHSSPPALGLGEAVISHSNGQEHIAVPLPSGVDTTRRGRCEGAAHAIQFSNTLCSQFPACETQFPNVLGLHLGTLCIWV